MVRRFFSIGGKIVTLDGARLDLETVNHLLLINKAHSWKCFCQKAVVVKKCGKSVDIFFFILG